ncbi:Hypothetical_protein [Hexamita inflata]|uniref:Hypothetical_protein n=1 Tax=Hexamita inflata TaxID=28002 RepID=A0AA86TY07_9EUKA|nr:Hypothetical protein HINF_LOCUS20789 [Hexamita inflata]
MIYLILVFQNQYIGPEPYTICVWFRYIYNLEISRAATPKQQTIFGVQVVYRSWPSGRNETTNRIRPPTRTGHCCFSSVSFITYSQKILKRPSAVAVQRARKKFLEINNISSLYFDNRLL